MIVYVVRALLGGDPERHSYVVGVYASLAEAEGASLAETRDRAGKYLCEIVVCTMPTQTTPVNADLAGLARRTQT